MNSIRALDRAIDILDSFSLSTPSLSSDEIARATKLPKATAYRLLYTMERRGLIHYDKETLRYRLGLRLLKYGGLITETLDLHNESEDILLDLFSETKQTVLMAALEHTDMVYVFRKEAPEGLKVSSFIGQRLHPTIGVMGHILLAYTPEHDLERFLKEPIPKLTPKSVTDPSELRTKVHRIREQGYLVDVEETTLGVTGVAAPVFGIEGKFVCSIGIIGPTVHMHDETLNDAIAKVLNAATKISQRMGYRASK